MAATLPNVELPPQVWVDLYASTGIAVGTEILVQNVGTCDVFLAVQAAAPVPGSSDDAYQVIRRSQFLRNDAGDPGAYAFCVAGGLVNVRLAP